MASVFFSSNNLSSNNSGLGFFGAQFGDSVNVSNYQDSTFFTDSNGLSQGPQVNNVKYIHPNSGLVNGVGPVNLLDISNYQATLKISFNHTSAVKTQNPVFRLFDRNVLANSPSGILCKCAEVIHPSLVQTGTLGSGSATWQNIGGDTIMTLISSPGYSGLRPNGSNTTSTVHDWFVNISVSPSNTGEKKFAGYFSVEYL